MGKIRTKLVGSEDIEKKQKEEAKLRRETKKLQKTVGKEEKVSEEKVVGVSLEEKADSVKEKKQKKVTKSKVKVNVRGKKYKAAAGKIDPKKIYKVTDAVALLKKLAYADFDETIELHLNLIDDGVKGEVNLPHGTGKQFKVAIADDALIAEIESGKITFDVLISHPSFMPKLAKHARVLGPKGLMPNPKNGTVSDKPEESAKKFAGGTIRYKSEDKFPLMHQSVGKLSFGEKKLEENINTILIAVTAVKIRQAFLKSTMSPSIRLETESV